MMLCVEFLGKMAVGFGVGTLIVLAVIGGVAVLEFLTEHTDG